MFRDLFVLASRLVEGIRAYQDAPQWDGREWDDVCAKADELEAYMRPFTVLVNTHKAEGK